MRGKHSHIIRCYERAEKILAVLIEAGAPDVSWLHMSRLLISRGFYSKNTNPCDVAIRIERLWRQRHLLLKTKPATQTT